jgi:hypothetical protein
METCLKESQDRSFLPELYNDHTGLPLAHANMALLSSCALGQTSKRAVFDNRWHGAFTWALVTILSQIPVNVYKDGRSFDITTDELVGRIYTLLGLVGNEQRPFNSSQSFCGKWEFLGGAARTPESVLDPVQLQEEVDAGGEGHIYEVESGGNVVGWMLRTKDVSISTAGHTFDPQTEYWLWTGAQSGLTGPSPLAHFSFRRPSVTPQNGTSLDAWVQAQSIPNSVTIQGCASGTFTPSTASPGASAWNVMHLGQLKARVQKLTDGLHWFRPAAAPNQPRISFGAAVVLPGAQVVSWDQGPALPGSFNKACVDTF